jgi:hypothetical protein
MQEHERCALWAGMGIGKTIAGLWVFDTMRILGELEPNSPTLVIGPARVAKETWTEERDKWEQFKNIDIVPLVGEPAQREKLLKRDAQFFTVSYENVPWLVEHYLERWPYRNVIADECDRLKGFREKKGGTSVTNKKSGASGTRAFQLGRIAHTLTKRWVNMGGTPAPNGYQDLWGQTWYLDRGARLGRTFSAYQDRWFRKKMSGYGIELMPHSKEQIDAALHDICLTVDPKDYFDLKEPIVRPVTFQLPKPVKKIYRDMERELFAELLCGTDVEVFSNGAALAKCKQIANGAIYTDAERSQWSLLHNSKLEILESVVHETGVPLLVAYEFRHDAERILRAFPKAVQLGTDRGLRAFKTGNAQMGIAHPGSMGHGIDGLQNVCNTLVRFGRNHNFGQTAQMLERIGPMRQFQAGMGDDVNVLDIIAEDTVDEDIMTSNVTKRSVQDCLLDAMKRRN